MLPVDGIPRGCCPRAERCSRGSIRQDSPVRPPCACERSARTKHSITPSERATSRRREKAKATTTCIPPPCHPTTHPLIPHIYPAAGEGARSTTGRAGRCPSATSMLRTFCTSSAGLAAAMRVSAGRIRRDPPPSATSSTQSVIMLLPCSAQLFSRVVSGALFCLRFVPYGRVPCAVCRVPEALVRR